MHRKDWFSPAATRRAFLGAAGTAGASLVLQGCAGLSGLDLSGKPDQPQPAPAPANTLGTGRVKAGLVLPLSAAGNAGVAAQAMRNAAELALSEFSSPDLQLLVKDDGGSAQGGQQAAQQAIEEGAEIILGPLFAHSVSAAAQAARPRGVPLIAFSTDATVAANGVFLLSFLPESDVARVVDYAAATGKRSFAALIPDNAYGSVVEAEFQQVVSRRGGRVIALERYAQDKAQMAEPVRRVAQAASQADCIFIPDGAESLSAIVQLLVTAGVSPRRIQIIGSGLWEDPRVFADSSLEGGLYPAPDPNGFRNFSSRYRGRFSQEPVRAAALAYDAVSLVAALAKTQGARRFSSEVLASSSGFSGIDGIFRFRPDGTSQRGLAILKVTARGGQVVSPAPKSFGA